MIIRNLAIVAFLASPIALSLGSLYSALANPGLVKSAVVAWVLVALALVIVGLNLYVAFVRPALYARRHGGSLQGYARVSGLPVVASIFVTLAVMLAWGQIWITCASLLVLFSDTGGVVCLLAVLSRDASFWRDHA
ncbi:hypothetical protein [Massilia sp. CF038]|uniref:hypothetical protein n=1 Tax=Massilia sp. CF038 TaxID=1881045 RepID=UPI0009334B3E|nr:hypothetical protein [Massilia sp. CF038]